MNVLDTLTEAWTTKRPELLRGILAPEFAWSDNAFELPITNVDELIRLWFDDIKDQQDIQIVCETISEIPGQVVGRWSGSYSNTEVDGIIVVQLNTDKKIVNVQQWWVTRSRP